MTTSNSDITINCPHCHQDIALSEAVTHQFREQLQHDFDVQRKAQEKAFGARERELAEKQEQIKAAEKNVEQQVQARLDAEKAKVLVEARAQAEEKLTVQLRDLQLKLQDKTVTLKEAQERELELRRKQAALEEKQETLALENQRKLDEERSTIREAAKRAAVEEQQLRMADKENVINGLKKEIEALQLKAEQGSQKGQGEVQEVHLENVLKAAFPNDEFVPVTSGTRGADLVQTVKTTLGQPCGTILWESKRTRNWSDGWLSKFKEDQRAHGADLGVIVTQALPKDTRNFCQAEGVWVTDLHCFVPLAAALRQTLVQVAYERSANTGKNEKIESLYSYMTGREFRQRIEGIVEPFVALREQLEAEKRATAKSFAVREKHLARAIESAARLYGDVQGVVGQQALPEIKVLALPEAAE